MAHTAGLASCGAGRQAVDNGVRSCLGGARSLLLAAVALGAAPTEARDWLEA